MMPDSWFSIYKYLKNKRETKYIFYLHMRILRSLSLSAPLSPSSHPSLSFSLILRLSPSPSLFVRSIPLTYVCPMISFHNLTVHRIHRCASNRSILVLFHQLSAYWTTDVIYSHSIHTYRRDAIVVLTTSASSKAQASVLHHIHTLYTLYSKIYLDTHYYYYYYVLSL